MENFIVRIITDNIEQKDTLYAEYHRNSVAPHPDPSQKDYPIESKKLLYYNATYRLDPERKKEEDSLLVTDTILYAGKIPFATKRKICVRDYYSIEIDSIIMGEYFLDFQWVDPSTSKFLKTNKPVYYYESNLIDCDIAGGLSIKVCSYDSTWTLDHFNAQFSFPGLERIVPVDGEDSTYGIQFQMLDTRYEFCSYKYFWENLPESVQKAIDERKIFIAPLMGI